MRRNRIILVILIVLSTILVSNYGGTISYSFFYFSLGIPVLSLTYSVYVYTRFKLYQFTENKTIVKGETTEYSFQLANEDIITFESLKVNFFHDKSKVFELDEGREYCLLPKQKIDMKTRITCEYRGEYYVGVESVVITDFLYLFRIKYQIKEKLPIQVLPRIVEIDSLPLMFPDLDHKTSYYGKAGDEEPDHEVRGYVSGDSRKRIHWKASAKRNELMTRKYIRIPEPKVNIFVDYSEVTGDEENRIVIEDKVLETVIAVSRFYCKKKIQCNIYYQQAAKSCFNILNEEQFQQFYQGCIKIQFDRAWMIQELIEAAMTMLDSCDTFLVITHKLTDELFRQMIRLREAGQEGALIYIYQVVEDEKDKTLRFIEQSGVRVLRIAINQDVKERLLAIS